MKVRTRILNHGCLFLVALLLSSLLGYFSYPVTPSAAQDAPIVVTNTASASSSAGDTQAVPTEFTAQSDSPAVTIVKTGDRSAAEPGEVVVYRLVITNSGNTTIEELTINDQLPLGLQFVEGSAQASPAAITSTSIVNNALTLELNPLNPVFNPGDTLSVVYAALITPDAIRGSGQNVAQASGPGFVSNQASHQLVIQPGIVSDCGTIVGRVFEDKNFDGQQQPGEPGIPNAVLFMDDGNRIVTDEDGLFSVINVISGYRTAVLDLSSLPGYKLAPSRYRIEDNSQSRLVRLAPGSLARMNFAVTPTSSEDSQ